MMIVGTIMLYLVNTTSRFMTLVTVYKHLLNRNLFPVCMCLLTGS